MKLIKNLGFIACICVLLWGCADNKSGVVQQTYIHKYGVELSKNDWTARGSNGKVISIMKNGTIVTKNYSNGILNGEVTYTFPHSETLEKILVYNKGQLVSEMVNYLSGSPMKSTEYLSDNETRITNWYDEGTPQSVELFVNGKLVTGEYRTLNNELEAEIINGNGLSIDRNAYGHLLSQSEVANGEVILETTYYSNGDPKQITPYQNGAIEGKRRFFLIGGVPNRVEEWFNGKQHGITIIYHNGEKQREIPYINGLVDGVERRYRGNDNLVEEIHWRNDKRHGPSNFYVDGKVQTDWYLNGKQVDYVVYD